MESFLGGWKKQTKIPRLTVALRRSDQKTTVQNRRARMGRVWYGNRFSCCRQRWRYCRQTRSALPTTKVRGFAYCCKYISTRRLELGFYASSNLLISSEADFGFPDNYQPEAQSRATSCPVRTSSWCRESPRREWCKQERQAQGKRGWGESKQKGEKFKGKLQNLFLTVLSLRPPQLLLCDPRLTNFFE